MPEPGGEFAVIGKKNKAAGHKIQPADIVQPLSDFIRQKPNGKGPSLGIGGTANISGRFVQGKVNLTVFSFYFFSVQQHRVAGKDLTPLPAYDNAVYADSALRDDPFCGPSGRNAGMGKINL
jgi:hypothetical protein